MTTRCNVCGRGDGGHPKYCPNYTGTDLEASPVYDAEQPNAGVANSNTPPAPPQTRRAGQAKGVLQAFFLFTVVFPSALTGFIYLLSFTSTHALSFSSCIHIYVVLSGVILVACGIWASLAALARTKAGHAVEGIMGPVVFFVLDAAFLWFLAFGLRSCTSR